MTEDDKTLDWLEKEADLQLTRDINANSLVAWSKYKEIIQALRKERKQADGTIKLLTEENQKLSEDNKVLREALEMTLHKYVDLANSGDCGFWDPETEDHVKEARQALEKVSYD